MRAERNRRNLEQHTITTRQAYGVLGGLLAFIVVASGAVVAEIISGHGDVPSAEPASIDEYAPYSGEQLAVSPLVVSGGWELERLKQNLLTAEERVWFDGSPETVAACNAAVVALNNVRIVKIEGQCTPPGTTTSTTP